MRDLLCGFSLLEQTPQYDNTGGMPLNFISNGFKQFFSSALARDNIQTINSCLRAKCKLRQICNLLERWETSFWKKPGSNVEQVSSKIRCKFKVAH